MLNFRHMFRILIALLLLCTLAAAQDKASEPLAAPANSQRASGDSSSAPPELRVIKSVRPVYPLTAVEKGIYGQVLLRILVSETGEVESAEVVSGDELLRQAALDAIKQWKFEPYVEGGKPIPVRTAIPINFDKPLRVENTPGKPVVLPADFAAGMLVHQVNPVFPALARMGRRNGRVVLHVLITKDGRVRDLTVVSGPKEFRQGTIDAVKQWRFKPYLLQGEPVEVDTTVEVNFSLGSG